MNVNLFIDKGVGIRRKLSINGNSRIEKVTGESLPNLTIQIESFIIFFRIVIHLVVFFCLSLLNDLIIESTLRLSALNVLYR